MSNCKLEELDISLIIDYRNYDERTERPSKPIGNATTYVLEPNDPVAAIASEEINSSENTVKKKLSQTICVQQTLTRKEMPQELRNMNPLLQIKMY